MRRQQTKSRKRHESAPIGERCEKGKVVFPDFDRADKAARQMTWKLRSTTMEVATPYVCPACSEWHIGRGPKGRDALAITNGEL
jgi:predicted RNA-binding Zn-ribbon protein involved in translation (DUF1610 family)